MGLFVLEQMQVQCLHSYLPRDGSAVQDLKNSWMWSTIGLPDHGRALTCSFAALCLARVGMVQGNQDLISQGRNQYALGLNAVQDALDNPRLAFQDRTLAAIRSLSIYEVRLTLYFW